MKRLLVTLGLTTSLLCGCSTISKWTSKATALEKTQTAINTTDDLRLNAIGKYAFATDIALENTNFTIAKTTNDRVQSLANPPALSDMKDMQVMVSALLTNNTKLLDAQDKKLMDLQNTVAELNTKLDKQTAAQLVAGQKNAAELDSYKGLFGLKAIFKGGKSLLLWLVIGAVVFFILKVASSTSPIAGGIFGIFESLGGMIIKGVKGVIGSGATEAASLVSTKYKDTLQTVIDSIETVKTQKAAGKKITLEDVLTQLSKTMNDSDKETITKLK